MTPIAPRLMNAGFDFNLMLREADLETLGLGWMVPRLPAAINVWGYMLPDILLPVFVQGLYGKLITLARYMATPERTFRQKALLLVEDDKYLADGIIDILDIEFMDHLRTVNTTNTTKALVLAALLQPDIILIDFAYSAWNVFHIMQYLAECPTARIMRFGCIYSRPYRLPRTVHPAPCFMLTKPFDAQDLVDEIKRCFWRM